MTKIRTQLKIEATWQAHRRIDWLPWWLRRKRIFIPGFNPLVGKNPWRKEWLPTPVFLPWCYSPWGPKESDTTEQLSLSHHASLWEVREGREGTVSNGVTLGGLTEEVNL